MKKARKYLFRPRSLLIAVFLCTGILVTAQTVSDASARKKSYKVTPESTVEVENKYGTILIVPWNKDSVQITADIYLEAKNNSKLRKLKNDVNVTFAGSSNYIIAQTRIGKDGSRVASELRTLSNTLVKSSTVEINYTIYLPQYVNVVLDNKFGDIFIDDLEGDVDISLSNGALKANHFSGNSQVELVFAKGFIRQMDNANVKLSYAELEMGHVNQMDLVSKSSELEIDTAGIVKMESRRDKIHFKEVEYLYGKSSFTDITVDDFIREADCDMNYGRLDINNLLPGFSSIKIDSDYTDVTLSTSAESSYFLDILHHEKAILNLPEKQSDLVRNRTGEEFFTTEGNVGGAGSEQRITINAKHKCFINITYN